MTIPSKNRCDAGLSNGKRCQNFADFWIVLPDPFRDGETWPIAVCELHKVPTGKVFHRLGPDRRKEYANAQAAVSEPATSGGQ